jgi:hypothetical protein
MEDSGDRFELTQAEAEFIPSRDSFYISTIGENGWPERIYPSARRDHPRDGRFSWKQPAWNRGPRLPDSTVVSHDRFPV